MLMPTDDLRILALHELSPPAAVIGEIPRSSRAASTVAGAREAIHRILAGADDRLVVIIGPCSVHDPDAALEYADRLKGLRCRLDGELEIVMRVYFEKPRTTIGWNRMPFSPP